MKLSVIIPSWKDKYLIPTIQSLLDNSELGSDLEVIIVLDGYWREDIQNDPRVKILHLGQNRGMRGAINAGMSIAKGEFVARSDEHCSFSKGWDRVLVESCQPNQVMTLRRKFLDPTTWSIMEEKGHVDYEKLRIQTVGDYKKFCGIPVQRPERDHIMVDETQAMQGSFWCLPKKWWDEVIVALDDERYQSHLQDSHEISFRTWKAGGKLMVNKNAYFCHKHLSFPRTHNLKPEQSERGIKNMMEDWLPYYREIKRTFTF